MSDRQMKINIVCPWCDTTEIKNEYKSYSDAYNPNKKWSIVKFYACNACNDEIIPKKLRPFKLMASSSNSSTRTSTELNE